MRRGRRAHERKWRNDQSPVTNDQWPEGLSDVSMYPNLFAELIRRGWSDRDLKLLAGENTLRVMTRADEVARSLSAGKH